MNDVVWNNSPSLADLQRARDEPHIIMAIFINDPDRAIALGERLKDTENASYLSVWHFNTEMSTDLPTTQEEARAFLTERMESQEDHQWFAPAGLNRSKTGTTGIINEAHDF